MIYIHTYACKQALGHTPPQYKKIPVCNISEMQQVTYFISYVPTRPAPFRRTKPNPRPYVIFYLNLYNPTKSSKTLEGAIKLIKQMEQKTSNEVQ